MDVIRIKGFIGLVLKHNKMYFGCDSDHMNLSILLMELASAKFCFVAPYYLKQLKGAKAQPCPQVSVPEGGPIYR